MVPHRLRFAVSFGLSSLLLATASASAKEAWTSAMDMEGAVDRADLIVVVRLVDMTETAIVHGGKQRQTTQQFTFQPVRTLKGIFARDSLQLTNDDLGLNQFGDGTGQLEKGQLRLMLLGRSGPGFFNCNQSASLDASLPSLKDENDPILSAVSVLIGVTQERDREAKVSLLLDGLRASKGLEAIPLLASLRRRGLLAAQTPGAGAAVIKALGHDSPDVRQVAAMTLQAMLDDDYLDQRALREPATAALAAALDRPDPELGPRLVALGALGSVGDAALRDKGALAWLRIDRESETIAERTARIAAIGRLKVADQRDGLAAFGDRLPLDASPEIRVAAGSVLGRLDPSLAAKSILARIKKKHAAGLEITTEIQVLGGLPAEVAVPSLIEVANLPPEPAEWSAFVLACQAVPDPRLIPTMAKLIDPRRPDLRWYATEVLRKIDTDEAAKVLQPHLADEGILLRKLEIAEFLGRHGIRDGYAFAIEHMSEPGLVEQAVAALGAIREPKAIPELRKVLATSNNIAWNGAAIRALGKLGEADLTPRFLELAKDLKNPLAPSALLALADLGEAQALPIILDGLASRNDQIVIASARAASQLLAKPGVQADNVRDRLAALLADTEATPEVRSSALNALIALDDPRLNRSLAVVVRDGKLEGTDLLARVEAQIGVRKKLLAAK